MKNSKSLFLTFISLLLILLSVITLWNAGFFHIKKHKKYASSENHIYNSKDKNEIESDSVIYAYDTTIPNTQDLSVIDSSNQINSLTNSNTNENDIVEAQKKINFLEQEIEKLKNTNSEYERKNQELFDKLKDQTNSNHLPIEKKSKRGKMYFKENTEQENDSIINFPNYVNNTLYTITELKFQAYQYNEENDIETDIASNTKKFSVRLRFNNNDTKSFIGDLMLVITQPDGKAFKGSPWQVGVFETSEGRRIYSCKFQIDCEGGDNKEVSLEFFKDSFMKGNYNLQVFKNGFQIGKTVLNLL